MEDQKAKYKVVPKGKATEGEGGVAGIRKRIRDAERLLRRPKLPATSKQELERRIKALNRELTEKARSVNESEIEQKYKFVKHLERKKVLKKITKIEKQIAELSTSEAATKDELSAELAQQRINLAYIEFYPKDMKYISLFPTNADEATPAAPITNKKKRKEPEAALTSDELRNLIQESVKNAVESGEAKKSNFTMRMRDVLDADQCAAYLEQSKLIKKVKTPIVVGGGKKDAEDDEERAVNAKLSSDKKQLEKQQKQQQQKKHKKDTDNDEEENDEDEENGDDDFFLSGDAEVDGKIDETIEPEDFFVERAVKEKKGPKDAAFKAPKKKGKIRIR
ncbi:18S rRNA maturation protein [Rhizoclosmatium hyalinum]|nr:18S rRNA maturation protein [Rhizoclosmatium hyalinum]